MVAPTVHSTARSVLARSDVCSEWRDIEGWFQVRGDTWDARVLHCPRVMRPRRWLGLEAGRQPILPPHSNSPQSRPSGRAHGMTDDTSVQDVPIRIQADEKIPPALAIGLGAQLTALTVAVPLLIPAVVMRATGMSEAYVTWAVFASVIACGATSALQAANYGRIGSGHVIMMGSSAVFIWPCIAAIERGGPPGLLVALVIVSALLQFVFLRADRAAPPRADSDRFGDRAHVGARGQHARRVRHDDRHTTLRDRTWRAAMRRGYVGRHRRNRSQVPWDHAPLGTDDRGRVRFDRGLHRWALRLAPRCRCSVDRTSQRRVAGDSILISGRHSGPCCRFFCS